MNISTLDYYKLKKLVGKKVKSNSPDLILKKDAKILSISGHHSILFVVDCKNWDGQFLPMSIHPSKLELLK